MTRLRPLVFGAAAVLVCVGARTAQSADATPVPTFAKDVAPIIYKNCTTCHRPGEIGPMVLQSFEDVRPWAKSIKDKVRKREMPPWFADEHNSLKMRNDRSLTDAQIQTIVRWVDGGAPKGNEKDLPALPTYAEGWQMGQPDYVFTLPVEWKIATEGQEAYLYFYEKIPFAEDRWARAIEIRPSNFKVVHHSGAYIVDLPEGYTVKDGYAYDPQGKQVPPDHPVGREGVTKDGTPLAGAGKLISYVPGRGIEEHPDGFAKRIPAGKYLRWVMHYNPVGQPEVEQSRLGIWWAKSTVSHEVLNLQAGSGVPTPSNPNAQGVYIAEGKEITYQVDENSSKRGKTPTIPPYDEAFKMVGITPVTEPITLYALTPHMHLRGKSMKWIVTYPDGHEVTVLDVPRYDFNWQIDYELDQSLKIPAGSKVTAIAYYDNSLDNRWNPAPEKEVYWSEQSWDEMFQPTTQFSVDSQDLTKKAKTEQPQAATPNNQQQ